MSDKCRKCNKIMGQSISAKDMREYCRCHYKPTPQTFEELENKLGVFSEEIEGTNCIIILLKDNNRIVYDEDGELRLCNEYEDIVFYDVPTTQAYEIITVMQHNIGGA